jgi:hypothetical protein
MKANKLFTIRATALLLVLVLLAGCGSTDQAKVLDEFTRYMSERNAEAAYELFSSIAKEQVTLEDLEAGAQGDFGDMLQGYKDLSVSSINVQTNQDGTYAELAGTVNLQDGTQINYTARLDKEGDAWLVTSMNLE